MLVFTDKSYVVCTSTQRKNSQEFLTAEVHHHTRIPLPPSHTWLSERIVSNFSAEEDLHNKTLQKLLFLRSLPLKRRDRKIIFSTGWDTTEAVRLWLKCGVTCSSKVVLETEPVIHSPTDTPPLLHTSPLHVLPSPGYFHEQSNHLRLAGYHPKRGFY